MVAKHLRSSWSNIDEDSITSESSRSDNQSLLLSQGKAHLILQPQSMLHQFYNLQNQQLQSMASYLQQPLPHLPKDQLAGHKPPLLQRPVLPNPARRRVQSVLHQSARSPDSALSGPRGIIESSRRMSSATQNAGERTAASGPMQGCDEQGLQLHRLASMRQGPASGATAERSLAPGASQAGAAGAKVTSSHSGKRNTIG
ncbi:hypothetical protein IWQ56_005160 [Coemansia nantahalensis]|nr:hypothetical protein IWQ56_005160 [Coemansia nantahalensis]